MKRHSLLVTAALAAGLVTAPIVYAQSTSGSGSMQRSPTDGRTGGTAPPSSTSGATPSTQPQQDMQSGRTGDAARDRNMQRDADRSGTRQEATPPSGRSPTDGRTGGTGTSPSGAGATPAPSPTPNTGSK